MDNAQAIHSFWSSFGLTAYDENTVPDNAMTVNDGKYITYSVVTAYFDEPVMPSASLWYKSTSWAEITQKAAQIGEAIGLGGKVLKTDDGYIWLKRGVPFAQRMSDEDDTIRRIYLNIEVEYFTSN